LGALAGTVLLVGNIDPRQTKASPLQWAVGFTSALSFAFYIVWSKRGLARYRPETVLFHTFWMAAVLWAFVTPPWVIIGAGYGLQLWAVFFVLATFSTLVPFLLFNAGLRRLRPTEAGVLSTLEPVVAMTSAAVFLGEWLTPVQNIGALLVLGSSALASFREADRTSTSSP
jgi:drug/metabolite transporter (DMT)-like permease